MEKSEFSETQFVMGYTRELFNSISGPIPFRFTISAPSTAQEKKSGSDLIIKHFAGRYYRYSEFYQFKRSKYFNAEIFSDLSGKITIDTATTPKYGFNIYNSKKTQQFNVLQGLSANRRNHVYYCAPLFHTTGEYNQYFDSGSIMSNSLVFDFRTSGLNGIIIPAGSNHQIIFDRNISHVCSEPIEVKGIIASERNKYEEEQTFDRETEDYFNEELKGIYEFLVAEIEKNKIEINLKETGPNIFDIDNILLSCFDVHWFPKFSTK